MTILELQCPLEVTTPKGKATLRLVIDYGMEANLTWVGFLNANGECWCFENRDIRLVPNITRGTGKPTPRAEPEPSPLSTLFQNPPAVRLPD